MSTLQEVWKDVFDYEGLYQASTWGRVKSLARISFNLRHKVSTKGSWVSRPVRERVLRPGCSKGRYPTVSLSKNGILCSRELHRLILETFKGPCPEGMEGCHKDGDKANNRLDNLRWDTRESNFHDNIANGTRLYKGKNPSYKKVTIQDYEKLNHLRKMGLSFGTIAKITGVGGATFVKNIIQRKRLVG